MGRIFNVLTTRNREVLDADLTGELSTFIEEELDFEIRKLRREIQTLQRKIRSYDHKITTFSIHEYLCGLVNEQKLHEAIEGLI